jgi:hypothetical protein
VVSLTSSSGGYINGRNSANLELLIDKTSSIYLYVKLKALRYAQSVSEITFIRYAQSVSEITFIRYAQSQMILKNQKNLVFGSKKTKRLKQEVG